MIGHERRPGRHYLKDGWPMVGVGRVRSNQCFLDTKKSIFAFYVNSRKDFL